MTNSAEFVGKKFSKHSLNWLWCDVISDPRTRSRSKCRETICTAALPRWAVPWRAQPSIASNFELEFWHIFRSFGQFTNDLTDKAWWTGTLLSWIYLRRQSYPWGQIINFANIQTPQHQNQSEVSCIARCWVQPSAWQGSGIDYLLSTSIRSSDSHPHIIRPVTIVVWSVGWRTRWTNWGPCHYAQCFSVCHVCPINSELHGVHGVAQKTNGQGQHQNYTGHDNVTTRRN